MTSRAIKQTMIQLSLGGEFQMILSCDERPTKLLLSMYVSLFQREWYIEHTESVVKIELRDSLQEWALYKSQ